MKDLEQKIEAGFEKLEKAFKPDTSKIDALASELEVVKKQMLKTNQGADNMNSDKVEIKKQFSIFNDKDDAKKLIGMVRKAANAAADFTIAGAIVPEQVASMWQGIIDRSQFLSKIATYKARKTSGDLKGLYPEARKLVQVADATLLAGNNAFAAKGHKYITLPALLALDLPYNTIDDNADDPNFKNAIDNLINLQFSNDLADLAQVGTHDDFAGSAFVKINKGFPQLFKDSVTAAVANYTAHVHDNGADADILETMDYLISGMPSRYKAGAEKGKLEFFLSGGDYEKFEAKIVGSDNTAALLIAGNILKYRGYTVNSTEYLTDGVQYFTDPKNLMFVNCLEGVRYSAEANQRRSCVEITINLNCDFVLLNDDMISFSYDS